MPQLADLTRRLPQLKEIRMSSSGIALWLCWQGDLNPAVPQTLQDYGGMTVVAERDQALWYFFSSDVFLALARLHIWAKFNNLPVAVQVLPAKLLLGMRREVGLSLDSALTAQEVLVPQSFTVWVHGRARESAIGIPGISMERTASLQGMANAEWSGFGADPRMPYQSTLGWYAVLHPLGNPLDKKFQAGWRDFFAEIEGVLQRHRLKFILHEQFLIFSLDNLRQFRLWVRDLLHLVREIKEQRPTRYWPCVSVIVDRKGFNFNNELPRKIRVDWEQLMPDFPHMSYRNAYLLGEGFTIHDVRFSVEHTSMDDWSNVGLDEEGGNGGMLPLLVSGRLLAGTGHGCFYCGMRNHETTSCPTRNMKGNDRDALSALQMMDFDTINAGFKGIEDALTAGVEEGFSQLAGASGAEGVLMRAIFALNSAVQLRFIPGMWLARGKDYPRGLEEQAPHDDNPVWDLYHRFAGADLIPLEKELGPVIARNPRDYRSRTLQGFIALERGDPTRALALWKEAATLCNTPLQQAWHDFLQGRLHEMQGRYPQANECYRQAVRLCPLWIDAEYRQTVCQVKMGFADQALGHVFNLIQRDPAIFNRLLVDPELERGHLQLFSALTILWGEAEKRAAEDRQGLDRLLGEVGAWFPDEHPFTLHATERIGVLRQIADSRSFVAFQMLINGCASIERELQARVAREGRELKERFKGYMERLTRVRDEAAWFPFPSLLIEFNRDYNKCAANLNWAIRTHFQTAESFKKAQATVETEMDRIKKLESRLKFLRIVRDATLFTLFMGRTFMWMEIGILLCILVVLPLSIYYGDKAGASWALGLASAEKWQVQKLLIMFFSLFALGLAALRTALSFEKRKDRLFREAQEKANKR